MIIYNNTFQNFLSSLDDWIFLVTQLILSESLQTQSHTAPQYGCREVQ